MEYLLTYSLTHLLTWFFISSSTAASSAGVLMLNASHGCSTFAATTRLPAAFRTPGQSVR